MFQRRSICLVYYLLVMSLKFLLWLINGVDYMDRFKARNFLLLLYPDDPSHREALQRLEINDYRYAYVLHDSDIWKEDDPEFDSSTYEVGQLKKKHFHVVLTFKNPIWSTSLADQLGIKGNYIRICHDIKRDLAYLIHYYHPNKYQYDLSSVHGPLFSKLEGIVSEDTEEDRVNRLIDLIEGMPSPTYLRILKASTAAGLYSDFRRMGAFAIKMILEELANERGYFKHND